MNPPEMFIVAGPPGAGNDRAAELNGGSYRAIPLHVRRTVNQEFE